MTAENTLKNRLLSFFMGSAAGAGIAGAATAVVAGTAGFPALAAVGAVGSAYGALTTIATHHLFRPRLYPRNFGWGTFLGGGQAGLSYLALAGLTGAFNAGAMNLPPAPEAARPALIQPAIYHVPPAQTLPRPYFAAGTDEAVLTAQRTVRPAPLV